MLNGLDEEQREQYEKLEMQLHLKGLQDEQKRQILRNQRDILERDRELQSVVQSLEEIHDMFKEFDRLVHEQQVSLDLIDGHLSKAETKVEQGVEHLKETEAWQCIIN